MVSDNLSQSHQEPGSMSNQRPPKPEPLLPFNFEPFEAFFIHSLCRRILTIRSGRSASSSLDVRYLEGRFWPVGSRLFSVEKRHRPMLRPESTGRR